MSLSHSLDNSNINLSLLHKFLKLLHKLPKVAIKDFLNALFDEQSHVK